MQGHPAHPHCPHQSTAQPIQRERENPALLGTDLNFTCIYIQTHIHLYMLCYCRAQPVVSEAIKQEIRFALFVLKKIYIGTKEPSEIILNYGSKYTLHADFTNHWFLTSTVWEQRTLFWNFTIPFITIRSKQAIILCKVNIFHLVLHCLDMSKKKDTPHRIAPKHDGPQGKQTHHLPSLVVALLFVSQRSSYQDVTCCPLPPSEGCWTW